MRKLFGMKHFYLMFFLGFILLGFSQSSTKTLLFLNAETKQPIEDVSVSVARTKQLYVSNADGLVTFELAGNSIIQITHTEHEPVSVRSTTLKEEQTTIYLKSVVNDLDEVIISNQHPQKILKNIIQNSISKLTIPSRLKVFSREFFKIDGIYSNYNDGLMNFQLSGSSDKINTDILVEQNRSFGLVNDNINDYLVGYNMNNIMQNYYNFKYLDVLLEPKAKKDFDFIIKSYADNSDYYRIIVTPTQESKGLLDDFTIVYDRKKKIIIEVNTILSPNTLAKDDEKKSVGSKNIKKSVFKSLYKSDNSNYYLLTSKEEIEFDKITKEKIINIGVRNYFVVANFSNQKFSFKEAEVFKDKTLFNKKNVILSNYWSYSGLTATKEEQLIIDEIEPD